MVAVDSATVLGWLKAAGEDSRLRLLALCARQEMSVSDLADALRQSEPRVSRHLRILCEAGLLERLRQGQWVHYRLTQNAAAAAFANGVLGQLNRDDPLFKRDRQRALEQSGSASSAARAGVAGAAEGGAGGGVGVSASVAAARTVESRLGRALKGFVEAVDVAIAESARDGAPRGPGSTVGLLDRADSGSAASALVVGVEHLELLEASGVGGARVRRHCSLAAGRAECAGIRRAAWVRLPGVVGRELRAAMSEGH